MPITFKPFIDSVFEASTQGAGDIGSELLQLKKQLDILYIQNVCAPGKRSKIKDITKQFKEEVTTNATSCDEALTTIKSKQEDSIKGTFSKKVATELDTIIQEVEKMQ